MSSTAALAPSELPEEEILAQAGAWARLAQRAGAQLLVLAYEWAVAHPAERLDPLQVGLPGRERATLIGGPGTPWGTTTSTGATIQLDHVVPWDPHGPPHPDPRPQTGVHNLAPLSTLHHRLKTHGRWQSAMPWPGVQLWRDPHGEVYLRDTSGTRAVSTSGAATETWPRPPALVVELYRSDLELLIELPAA